MLRKCLPRVLTLPTLVLVLTARPAAAEDGSDTTVPDATVPTAVPTSIPDDFLTLFPEWTDDNLDYLDPHTSAASLPGTGTGLGVLAIVSSAAVVTGAGLSLGAGRRARRR